MGIFYIKNKIKRLLVNIFISILGLTLIFITFEVLSRVYAIKTLLKNSNIARRTSEDFWNQYDPVLGWRHIPGKSVRNAFGGIPVIINKQGFRADKDYDLKRRKILAMGCSYTFGYGVSGNDAWPKKLEEKLKSGDFDYDVINMGACAYGLDQNYLWFLEQEKELKPDIVIFGMSYSLDRIVRDRLSTGHGKPRFKVIKNRLVLTNVPSPGRIEPGNRIEDWQGIFFNPRKSYFLELAIERSRLVFKIPLRNKPDEDSQITEKILEGLAESCKENKIKFIFVLIDPVTSVKEILVRRNIDFIECFETLDGKEGVYLPNDRHPSSYGHELIADQVYKFLLKYREKYLPY